MSNVVDKSESEVKCSEIDRITCDVSYAEFFEKFMLPNIPCLIQEDITKYWLSRKLWVNGNKPNFQFLREKFGSLIAPVANCKEYHFGSHKKNDLSISEFLSYWEEYIMKNYPVDMPVLYLKDWHLKKDFPDSSYYEVPSYFGSDWLNEFWSERNDINDDYSFVYMGPKGSWTPEHEDVFSSYSWSANIVGRKKWLFYPPKLKDGKCYFITADEEASKDRKVIELIQESGEIIFVPSGWRHEVFNLEDTISINHNWVNACNLENWMWPSLNSALSAVEMELKDCLQDGMDAWEEQCQVLLKAVHGIDFIEFYAFLRATAEPRVDFLITTNQFSNSNDSILREEKELKGNNKLNIFKPIKGEEECSNRISLNGSSKVAEDEGLKLCYDPKPVEVMHYKSSDNSLSKKVIELKSDAADKKEEILVAMVCRNGWWLGMLHAFYDIWKIKKVMESLLSHKCVPKLEFFQKLIDSKSHQEFMNKLNSIIYNGKAMEILKPLNGFL